MIELYPYQLQTCRQAWSALNRSGNCLIVAPTGSGKTIIGSFLLKQLQEHKGFDAMIFAHRREIVKQTEQKLQACGLSAGVLMAGEIKTPWRGVQVASIDSYRIWVRNGKLSPMTPKFVWLDECHRGLSPTYLSIIKEMREAGAQFLGTTATPIRSDGRGLGRLFDEMVLAPSVAELIALGYLVPARYYVGIVPDVSGVKLTAGDYDQRQLEEVVDQQLLIGDIISNWAKLARDRPTLVFASGVNHSIHLVEKFKALGVNALHIDGSTNTKIRDKAQNDLATGKLDVICNANVYIEGTDIPPVSCIVDAQPTKSLGRYRQKGGRGFRTSPATGKRDLLYLDHAGNVYQHGRLEMEIDWTLTEGLENAERAQDRHEAQPVARACQYCGMLFSGRYCPNCGKERVRQGKERDYLPAELAEMSEGQYRNIERIPSPKDKAEWYAQALGNAQAMKKKPGWAYHCFMAKWGEQPPDVREAKAPSKDVRNYMKSCLIRAAKRVKAQPQRELL